MKRIIGFTFLTLFVFILIQVFGPGLPAQNRAWNQNNQPSEGVCLYMDADYKGEEFCIDGNENQARMDARYNNRVSSVRVFGGARLTVYEDANYKGSYQTYSQDVPNLRNWGDRVSSFQVKADRQSNRRGDGQPGGRYNDWVRGNESREGVCFYADTNYQGEEFCVDGNENQQRLDQRFRNKISSVRISGNTQVTVFENPNFNGASQALSQDTPNLGNWSDRIASFRVKPDRQNNRRNDGQTGARNNDWVRGNESREGVCFYADTNYRGDELCVDGNQNQQRLDQRFRNKISSVRISGNTQVTVFENPNFNGASQALSQDNPNLGNWSDRIASFQVRPDSRVDRRNRDQNDGQRAGWGLGNETRNSTAGQRDGWGRDNDSRPRACFYTDSDYRGSELCLERNTNQRNLDGRFDDKISSVRIYGGAQVIAYEHKEFGGTRRTIDRDAPGLGDFNDKITSVEVR